VPRHADVGHITSLRLSEHLPSSGLVELLVPAPGRLGPDRAGVTAYFFFELAIELRHIGWRFFRLP
jgi:hypothetical protein